ncbi:hypothetical protein [uncultured Acinetobacter sp.]|uniref:hypothetical protein n=1 Tax=uncultured Acinetobacter sp. TaxID=165433 RepID=UPI002583A87E|nr:hypothetical protein [uncultured Acinetobacter sp.]
MKLATPIIIVHIINIKGVFLDNKKLENQGENRKGMETIDANEKYCKLKNILWVFTDLFFSV